ncbi:MAG: phosphate-starvation-inducible PsiE family protein [Smithellaceae bacterium]|nr:phosphate-starvation-inducible PsiE family protein [Smithellaceae bacterium]
MKIPNTQTIFRMALNGIIVVMTAFIIIVLIFGLFHTISVMKVYLIDQPGSRPFNAVVIEVLTFLVIIELFRSFVGYFDAHRFRLSTMIDPAIIFVIRELIVKLYDEKGVAWEVILAFGFLILCLGTVRTMAVRFSPDEDPQAKV